MLETFILFRASHLKNFYFWRPLLDGHVFGAKLNFHWYSYVQLCSLSLVHILISFVVITTPYLPPRGLSTGSASSIFYYWVWSLISFQWKHVALAKLCLQNAILSLQLWKCCRQTHIKGRRSCGYLLYLVLHSVVLVYFILSFRMYVKFKQLWFTVILKQFNFFSLSFFLFNLLTDIYCTVKLVYTFSHWWNTFLVRFGDRSMLCRFVRVKLWPIPWKCSQTSGIHIAPSWA